MTAEDRRVWEVTIRLRPELFRLHDGYHACWQHVPTTHAERWVCTLESGHQGPHVAHVGDPLFVGLIWEGDQVLYEPLARNPQREP